MNRTVYSACDTSMQDLNKGKSFRFSAWNSQALYLNDSYIQDFVSYMGSLYACIQSNTNTTPDNNLYWQLVISGIEGQKGEKGDQGIIFTPHVSSDGILSWTNDGELQNPVSVNIKGPKGDASTVPGPKGDKGDKGDSITGPQGPKGDPGIGLEFSWEGTKLGVRRAGDEDFTYVDLKGSTGVRGTRGPQGIQGVEGPQGPKGDSLYIQVSEPNAFGQFFLQKRYNENEPWVSFFDLSTMRGPKGDSIIVERDPKTGDVYYRYENEDSTANKLLIYKDEIKGPAGDTIARTYVADDGYLYIQLTNEDIPRRVGYVRGDRGADGREIVLRVYSGPSVEGDETRWGTHLQWKYAGDDYKLWTNLIQINDLMHVAQAGLKLDYDIITEPNEAGVDVKYERVTLSSYRVEFDENGHLKLTDKIATISSIQAPTKMHLLDVKYLEQENLMRFIFDTAVGERVLEIDCDQFFKEGNGIVFSNGNVININIADDSENLADGSEILTVDRDGLRVTGLKDKLIKEINLIKTETDVDTHYYHYDYIAQNGKVYPIEIPDFVEWETNKDGTKQIFFRNEDKLVGWDSRKVIKNLIRIDASDIVQVGDGGTRVNLQGNDKRPYYNSKEISLLEDLLAEIAGLHIVKEDAPEESDIAARYRIADRYNNILGTTTIDILKDKFLKSVTYDEKTYTFTFEFWINDDPEEESHVQTVSFNLQELVDTINTRIDEEVKTLNDRIGTEVSTLNDRIDTEVEDLNDRITSEVNTLNGRIDTEVDTLNTRIDTEVKTLNDTITEEVKTLNERIDSEVDTLNKTITTLEEKHDTELAAEKQAREAADTQLQANIDAEAEARQNADDALDSKFTDAVNAERTARESADDALQININNEATARETADETLQDNIDAEATTRETSDTELKNAIDALETKHNESVSDINNYLVKIYPAVFPLSVSVTGGKVCKLGTTQNITINWVIKEGNDIITPKTLSINDETLDVTVTSKLFENVTSATTYTVKTSNAYEDASGSTTIRFVNPSYFGTIGADTTVTEDIILGFTENIKNSRSYTVTTSLTNGKTVYAYPSQFGALTSIKDADNFECINSYTRSEMQLNGENYYVYVLTDATSINSFKQIYS